MENLTYTSAQINEVLNLINTLPAKGIENCNKIVTIYQILNNNVKIDNNAKVEVNKADNN